jgi:hypothetical protein
VHRVDIFATDTSNGTTSRIGSRTVTVNRAPSGVLDVFNGSTIAGWAFDGDVGVGGAGAVQVLYKLDQNAPRLATADAPRADLLSHVGSTGHGFVINLPQLTAGSHSVTVWAVDPYSRALTLIGKKTATVASAGGNTLPHGWLDISTSGRIAGWARDANTPGTSVNVQLVVDGVAGTPFVADSFRPDLGALHGNSALGFDETLTLSPGQHRVDVYMLDGSTPVLLASRIVGTAAATGFIDVATSSVIRGWAHSPAYGGGPAIVRLEIDGHAGGAALSNLSRADLTPVLGSDQFAFTVTTPPLAAGSHVARLVVMDPLTLATSVIMDKRFVTT